MKPGKLLRMQRYAERQKTKPIQQENTTRMTNAFQSLVNKIHYGTNPWAGWPYDPNLTTDFGFVGWTGYFDQAIDHYRPDVIIEVGVLFGASSRHMAQKLKNLGIDGAVISADTYLQEQVLWNIPEHRERLRMKNGRSQAYELYMNNGIKYELQDYMVPLAGDSRGCARHLLQRGVTAPVIYIDGSHMKDDVYQDYQLYWPLLRPGGVMIGDDYNPNGFAELVADVNRFAAENYVKVENHGDKLRIFKPA